jgi:site-specific DNA recombinase
MMNQIPVFVYGRYSTEGQDDGTSMENQMLACRMYAEAHGYVIVKEFKDYAVSGSLPMNERPAGKQMEKAIESGEYNVKYILALVSDRLFRGSLNSASFRDFLDKRGIELLFPDTGIVNRSNRLLQGIKEIIDEEELETITRRLKNGRRNQVSIKKKMVLAVYSYGYDKIGKGKDARLEINPEQARRVKEIFELYVYKNLSQMAIAEYLNAEGVFTFSGNKWASHTINQTLGNLIYKGVYAYGKSEVKFDPKTKKKKPYKLPPEQWLYLDVPELAIITPELWELAQERSKKNKVNTRWTSRNRGRFLLTSFITCPHCKRKIGGFTKKNFLKRSNTYSEYTSYGCRNHACPAYGTNISQYKLDAPVWNWIKEQLNNDERLLAGINRLFQIKQDNIATTVDTKEDLTDLIKKLGKKISRLTVSLANFDEDETEAISSLESQISIFSKEKTKAEKELKKLEAVILENGATEKQKEETLALARAFKTRMEQGENAPTPNKRRLLEMLNLHIELDLLGKKAKVSWGFGNADELTLNNNNNGSNDTNDNGNNGEIVVNHEIPLLNSISRFIRFETVIDLLD